MATLPSSISTSNSVDTKLVLGGATMLHQPRFLNLVGMAYSTNPHATLQIAGAGGASNAAGAGYKVPAGKKFIALSIGMSQQSGAAGSINGLMTADTDIGQASTTGPTGFDATAGGTQKLQNLPLTLAATELQKFAFPFVCPSNKYLYYNYRGSGNSWFYCYGVEVSNSDVSDLGCNIVIGNQTITKLTQLKTLHAYTQSTNAYSTLREFGSTSGYVVPGGKKFITLAVYIPFSAKVASNTFGIQGASTDVGIVSGTSSPLAGLDYAGNTNPINIDVHTNANAEYYVKDFFWETSAGRYLQAHYGASGAQTDWNICGIEVDALATDWI